MHVSFDIITTAAKLACNECWVVAMLQCVNLYNMGVLLVMVYTS